MNHMKKQVEILQKSPSRVYGLMDFKTLSLLPWAKDERTVRKILEQDKKGSNILHAKITGTGSNRRYLVEGRYIIKYLQIYGPALMGTVRKPKKIYGKRRKGGRREESRESGNHASKKSGA